MPLTPVAHAMADSANVVLIRTIVAFYSVFRLVLCGVIQRLLNNRRATTFEQEERMDQTLRVKMQELAR